MSAPYPQTPKPRPYTVARKSNTTARIRRLVEAAKGAGLQIGAIEEAPDGTVRVIPAGGTQPTDAAEDWLNAQA